MKVSPTELPEISFKYFSTIFRVLFPALKPFKRITACHLSGGGEAQPLLFCCFYPKVSLSDCWTVPDGVAHVPSRF